jgi:hypothetical protein
MYSVRKLAAVATVGLSLALPMAAHADGTTTCNSPVENAAQGNTSQTPSDTLARACVSGVGYIAVGADTSGHVFVVGEHDQLGYVGVSNQETGAKSPCTPADPDGNEGGSGTNSGGCYGTNNNPVSAPLPLVCGDNTGPWYNSSRDGCRVDQEDASQLVDFVLSQLP